MDIPDSLRHRIELFRETGRVFRVPSELFAENSWIQVMLGQGIEPQQHHPVADLMGDEELARFLDGIKSRSRRPWPNYPRTRPTSSNTARRAVAAVMANIYEVAELAGVSLATVSRVINPGAKVSEKTRQKVLDAMQQLGYQPNSIAQSLATRSSNAVGVLVSELHGPFFGAMLSAIEQTLKAAGKFVLVAAGHSNEEQEREAIRFLVSRNCDALIVHVERLLGQIPGRSRSQHHAAGGDEPQGARTRRSLLQSQQRARRLPRHAVAAASASTNASPTSPARSTGWMPSSASRATSARWPRRASSSTSACCTRATITRPAARTR